MLVAVIVIEVVEVTTGAVKTPLADIEPPVVLQRTVEFCVPETLAVNAAVPLDGKEIVLGWIETLTFGSVESPPRLADAIPHEAVTVTNTPIMITRLETRRNMIDENRR